MNKKKFISATLALSLGLSGTYAIAPFANENRAVEAAVNSAFNVQADVSVQQNQIASFEEIKSFFQEESVDLAKVKAYYEENFKAAVQERNELIDEKVSQMLELGVQGSAIPGQVKQAVDKGLQWFFYDEVRYFDNLAGQALAEGNIELANQNLDKAITLFEGSVYVTAGKRDGNFGTLTQDFFENIAVPGMRSAVEKGYTTNFHVWRQYFEKTMMKVFVMATTRYANIVPEDHAAGDTEAEKVHLAEGYFFFLPIHKYLAGGDQEAADSVKEAFESGDGSKVDPNKIESALTQAITVKTNGYIDTTINKDMASGDLDKALIHAAEANVFASQLEIFINDELGKEAYTQLQTIGADFYNAVEANNSEEATKYGKEMTSLISQLSGNQIAHFEKVKSFFSADEVDLAEVKSYYEEHLAPLVKQRNTKIDDEISFVLKAGVNGVAIPGQVKQAVDKGLQWYFYEEVNHLVKSVAGEALKAGDKEKAADALDRALKLFQDSVYVTAGKRDGNFDTLTQNALDQSIEGLEQAIENEDVTMFNVSRQYFEKTMMKVFVLATTRYAEKIPADHAAGDIAEEKIHLAEGYFFFMPIYNYLSGADQEAADYIKDSFSSADGSNFNAEKVKEGLIKVTSIKTNGYIDTTINKDLASGNHDKALVHAAEANVFASQLEYFINNQLGKDTYAQLVSHGENFYNAVAANNAAEAQQHGAEMSKIIAQLNGNKLEEVKEAQEVEEVKEQKEQPKTVQPERTVKQDKEETTYIVKKGDTLSQIGLDHDIDWKVLAEHNNLANPNLIIVGQKIIIPAK